MTVTSPAPTDRDALPQARLWLSALADGDRDREALAQGTALWREDGEAREAWHLYHLIGDVLRSEDLACAPVRDATFLTQLRERLAHEPVPLAPAAMPAATAMRRLGWRAPAAVAAGFVAVGVTLVLMRPGGFGNEPGGARLAVASPAAAVLGGGVRVVSNSQASAAAGLIAEGRMIRDARLDAYLRAHQAARGNSPAALPGGGLRSVELLVSPDLPLVPAQSLRAASERR